MNTSADRPAQQSSDVLVIAGEASGDAHGAALIRELGALRPDLRFWGIGGDRMRDQGVELRHHASDMSVVGFIEVARRYRFFKGVFRGIVEEARRRRPAFAILVDYPGFNLRLARELRAAGIPVVYYIAPQVWAWKEGRVETLRSAVDDLIVVFPFEIEYFSRHGITAHFFGHPLIDRLFPAGAAPSSSDRPGAERRTIAYLPGSRPEEIRRHMPVLVDVMQRMGPGYRHVVPRAATVARESLDVFRREWEFEIVPSVEEALSGAAAALVKSGTSTVETALHRVPFAVIYRTSPISYAIAKYAIKVSSIAMVNLLLGRQAVREYIQDGLQPEALVEELHRMLDDESYRARMLGALDEVRGLLGENGAARRAAAYIAEKYR
jgi:lipid-A-disaccharide synthase